jgi:hypothetical protein
VATRIQAEHKKKEKTDWQSAQYKESNGGKNATERNKTREADEIKLTVKVIE